jgi:hypothetical protein
MLMLGLTNAPMGVVARDDANFTNSSTEEQSAERPFCSLEAVVSMSMVSPLFQRVGTRKLLSLAVSWYNFAMTPKLTNEQREALKEGAGLVPVEDDQTHQVYFLVDRITLGNADRDAIREGIADMEAGRVLTLDELDARIRSRIEGTNPA